MPVAVWQKCERFSYALGSKMRLFPGLTAAYFVAAVWGAMLTLLVFAFYTMRGRFELGRYLLALAGQISAQATNVFGLVFVSELLRMLRPRDVVPGQPANRLVHLWRGAWLKFQA